MLTPVGTLPWQMIMCEGFFPFCHVVLGVYEPHFALITKARSLVITEEVKIRVGFVWE